jgi:lipoprotein NlpD
MKRLMLLSAASVLLAGCASRGTLAPVEERVPQPVGAAGGVLAAPAQPAGSPASPPAPVAPAAAVPAPEPAVRAPAEVAVPPGHYQVKQGDTLVRIGLDTGQNWRDIARWNNIDNPNVLEVGQVLRVIPPASEAGAATARPVAPAPRVETRPLDARAAPAASAPAGATPPAAQPAPPTVAASAPPSGPSGTAATPPAAVRESDGDIAWSWPATGPVTVAFDEARSKGLSIAGKAGDPVLAAADGRVVYAGSGLRGYGNLVIVKHNATFLTAYAHNQSLLVKEDQIVKRGQKIAEMGSSDSDRVQLHFEVRRQGKPVDPARVLPPR